MSCHGWVFISLLAKLASAVLHRLGFAAAVCPLSPHIIEQPAGSGCDMDSPPNNQASNQSKRPGNFDSLPFLTADLPGTGGKLKQEPEDFVVEEIPAYEPCGEGEHLFLWVEKQDVSGEELLRHVARRLGIPSGDQWAVDFGSRSLRTVGRTNRNRAYSSPACRAAWQQAAHRTTARQPLFDLPARRDRRRRGSSGAHCRNRRAPWFSELLRGAA